MHIVNSISGIDTQQQQPNPYNTAQYVAPTVAGKNRPGKSFAEHLNSQIQKISASAVNIQADDQAKGIFMGYYLPMLVSPRPETRLTVSAYKSNSDL